MMSSMATWPTSATPMVAFTTPANYSGRLSELLLLNGLSPLWSPTIAVSPTPLSLTPHLQTLHRFSAVAFTSRTGIAAFSTAAAAVSDRPLLSSGGEFTVAALGSDAELLDGEFVSAIACDNGGRDRVRVRVLVPPVATPGELARSLGDGAGRRVLCPVPVVVGLEEPPVVPDFLRALEARRWVPVRGEAYETRWVGPTSAAEVVARVLRREELEAVVFTSTAEVEGFLKSLKELGTEWRELRARAPAMVVAAHGPVTKAGAERLGVKVDVVGQRFDSFHGVVNALCLRLKSSCSEL